MCQYLSECIKQLQQENQFLEFYKKMRTMINPYNTDKHYLHGFLFSNVGHLESDAFGVQMNTKFVPPLTQNFDFFSQNGILRCRMYLHETYASKFD